MPFSTNGHHKTDPVQPPSPEEIQYAHDVLTSIIELGIAQQMGEEDNSSINSARDTLCWILGHPGKAFPNNLKALEGVLNQVSGGDKLN